MEATAADDELPALEGNLTTRNASGRSGAFFLPRRAARAPIPVLVALHGQGSDGLTMIPAFRGLASTRIFAVVAPSSNYVPEMQTMTWRVGDHPNDVTDDYRHVQACLEEVASRVDVTVDRARVLIAGFSGGASSAPYIASNTAPYDAFAVLHGGVFLGGIGPRKIRGWFSTGERDNVRAPDHVAGHFRSMQGLGFDVVFHLYPGGHAISSPEASELVEWWLRSPVP